jgi:hypothetical protein
VIKEKALFSETLVSVCQVTDAIEELDIKFCITHRASYLYVSMRAVATETTGTVQRELQVFVFSTSVPGHTSVSYIMTLLRSKVIYLRCVYTLTKNMIIIIYTNKRTTISLLNIHHVYMFRPNSSSSGHLQDTKVLKCV